MGWLERVKALILTKSESPKGGFLAPPPEKKATPPSFIVTTQPTPIPQPVKPSFTVAKPRGRPIKISVLRTAAKLLIILNLGVALLFYSTNWGLNLTLWTYLGIVTIILGHYLSVSK